MATWIRERIETCATCGETTPHSRRVIALPLLLASALVLAGLACFLYGGSGWVLGGLLGFVALFVFFRDRERFWRIACERCRGKRVAEIRATDPRLGSTTIIDWF